MAGGAVAVWMGWKMALAGTFGDGGAIKSQRFDVAAVVGEMADLGRDGLALLL